MASKTVNIPIDEWFAQAQAWFKNFFATITQPEMIAVGAIGLGLILVIVGLVVM